MTTHGASATCNAKQEVFWATLEGRLMAMLEGVEALTLERLNEITQVWVQGDYQQVVHSEIATSPLQRYRDAAQAGRDCPDSERLRQAFRCTVKRRQRRSDGAVVLSGGALRSPTGIAISSSPCCAMPVGIWLLDFLHALTTAIENQYFAQIYAARE